MKVAIWGFVALALFMSVPLCADESSKEAKIVELMKLQGLSDMIEQMRADSIKRAEVLRPQYQKQLHDSFPDAPADFWIRFDAAYKHFVESTRAAWSTDDAVKVYGDFYAAQLSEDELDQILSYYRSAIGQKDVEATKRATPLWSAEISKKYQVVYQANMQKFLDDMSETVKQCRAAKLAGSQTCDITDSKSKS